MGDDGLAFLFQQLDQPPLLRHQRVDLRRLAVEKGGDGVLLGDGGTGTRNLLKLSREQTPVVQLTSSLPDAKNICCRKQSETVAKVSVVNVGDWSRIENTR